MSYSIRNICTSIAIALGLFSHTISKGQTHTPNTDTCHITGVITDEKKEPLIGATVRLYKNNRLTKECATDVDGLYSLSIHDTGYYDMVIAYVGYMTSRITRILVNQCNTITINRSIEVAKNLTIMEISMCCCHRHLIDKWPHPTGQTFTSEQIEKMAH